MSTPAQCTHPRREQSVDGSTGWTNATGTSDTQHYTTPALTSNMYYRRTATNATCNFTHTSNAALITVTDNAFTQPNPVRGTVTCIAPTYTFYLGVATGGSGTLTYNWQQRSVGGNWENATGTRNQANYTTPALTVDMEYRRQAIRSTCGGTIISDAALVTVNDGEALCAQKGGVFINCVCWAKTNVNAPGTFAANPEDFGMFYQWNRKIGWSATDPMINSNGGTTWDSSEPTGTTWTAANDPSPAGWRVPTLAEFQRLINNASRVSSSWRTLNGKNGVLFTDRVNGNTLFLPAAGFRSGFNGSLNDVGTEGQFWSRNRSSSSNSGVGMCFRGSNNTSECYTSAQNGFSVRSVAE